ncbi:hypothetical protein MZM54_00310 [[Brevibacterium] frigoritolerans]|nr:hypothetical protein [Peribacillus frigoritolerans]
MKPFIETYAKGTEKRKIAEETMRYVGADIRELYITGNPFNPYLLWDGRFTTLELMTVGEELKSFQVYENTWDHFKTIVAALEKDHKFLKIFNLMSIRIKFSVFKLYKHVMPEDQAYKVFKSIYSSSEYNFDILDWEDVIELCRSQNKEDIQLLKSKVGNEFTIYRGETNRSDKEGYSWTTDYGVAACFANRFDSNGVVIEGKVKTDDVLTFIDGRGESEVLVPREFVQIISV